MKQINRHGIVAANMSYNNYKENLEYFCIEALEDGLQATLFDNECEYSLDGKVWINLSYATNTTAVNTGEKIYFRGNLTPTLSYEDIGSKFTISKKCNLKGNIMSLLYGEDFIDKKDLTGKDYAFCGLFYDCTTIVDVSELILPATTLANCCYDYMFYNCTSLTTAPALPATTLASSCYSSMFEGCTSLTTAPALPATTLASGCYHSMFYGTNVLPDCSNIDFTSELVVASGGLEGLFAGTKVTDADLERILPKNNEGKYCLPVTTLADYCYIYMFYNCKALTQAPALPATTLARSCYIGMFKGCTSLTTAPALPATTLADYCYRDMFYYCTSLTTAPALPATTLSINCYRDMFSRCKQLNYIKMLATDISASYCLNGWVNGVASTGTFVKHPDMTSLPTGTSGIPSGWTVVNDDNGNGGFTGGSGN